MWVAGAGRAFRAAEDMALCAPSAATSAACAAASLEFAAAVMFATAAASIGPNPDLNKGGERARDQNALEPLKPPGALCSLNTRNNYQNSNRERERSP